MPAVVVLFRSVNVGGRSIVSMVDLRRLAVGLGLGAPRTIGQSGNLVATTDGIDPRSLEGRIETAAKADLGIDTHVLVRSAAQWHSLVEMLPFPDFARANPSRLLAVPLRDAPASSVVAAFEAGLTGTERVAVRGDTAYLVHPDGIGRSKLTMAFVERRLGTIGTGRNWNTVIKVATALSG